MEIAEWKRIPARIARALGWLILLCAVFCGALTLALGCLADWLNDWADKVLDPPQLLDYATESSEEPSRKH